LAQSVLIQNVALTEQFSDEISASSGCGEIIIDIDESQWTKGFKEYVAGILFRVYVKVDEEYILVQDRGYLWNTDEDVSVVLEEIPNPCYISMKPTLNDEVKHLKNKDGNYLYPELQNITSLPISIIFDDSGVIGEGGSVIDILNSLEPIEEVEF